MKVFEANERLCTRYSEAWRSLVEQLPRDRGLSNPHFLSAPSAYFELPIRLMVVGQQTNGWSPTKDGCFGEPLGEDPVRRLLKDYEDFALGLHYVSSPFWQAAHLLHKGLNPKQPCRAFVWSNLVKIDQCGRRPSEEYENVIAAQRLLQFEIETLKPLVIVFFTGPSYQDRLNSTFPEAIRERLDRCKRVTNPMDRSLTRIKLTPSSTALGWETYHPNYLRRSKQWAVLDRIIQLTSSYFR